ncbi:MAG: 50S ribosome-binding GTPase [Myxococcales bacterium]|nr:50S ribosome-binding GTPase [Myxococcales bacterium]
MGAGPERETLVGVATGRPDGGLAVVRISGPRARALVEPLVGSLPAPRRLARRRIGLGDGEVEDGLVVLMPGPRSFTGEDVVELHVHAGARNVDAVVGALLRGGARAAGAGDFSRRAFELGRLSLDQAEGLAAIIGARTDAALSQARRLAAGELGRTVDAEREALLELRAEIEANLDFPEDVDPADVSRWQHDAAARRAAIEGWLARFEAGRRARARARVVLAGPPNAGKSSLFNALLGRERALVADGPGTTRDYVEADLELGRHGCTLVDTAGLREGAEEVERAGVALSRAQVEGADVVLWIEGADAEQADPSQWSGADEAVVIRVETKRDRGQRRPAWLGVALRPGGPPEGLEQVRQALLAWFGAGQDTAWIGLARHHERAHEALAAIEEAQGHLADDEHLELAAFALGVAESRLGEITGRSALGPVGQDVLDRIFARFCIGK